MDGFDRIRTIHFEYFIKMSINLSALCHADQRSYPSVLRSDPDRALQRTAIVGSAAGRRRRRVSLGGSSARHHIARNSGLPATYGVTFNWPFGR
jgi:hypothetical protein